MRAVNIAGQHQVIICANKHPLNIDGAVFTGSDRDIHDLNVFQIA